MPIATRAEEERLMREAGWKPHKDRVIDLLTEIRDAVTSQAPAAEPQPASDQHSLSIVRSVAIELEAAAEALEASAKQLKEDGKGWRAGHAKQAAMRARAAAQDLSGA